MAEVAARTAIVRLSNWIGDVVLTLPALQLLQHHGWRLELVGKGWARSLLSGTGWSVQAYPRHMRERIALLRGLRVQAMSAGAEVRALSFPNSIGSALEFRLAGAPAVGYRKEGRSLLLGDSLPLPSTPVHEVQRHWALAARFLGLRMPPPAPDRIVLPVPDAATQQARALLRAQAVGDGYVVIVPFATGHFSGQDKKWPHFPALTAALLARGRRVVACPGPGEDALIEQQHPGVVMLRDVDLATYLAVLQGAAMVVANDTGPGHMAAAVGVPLVSLLGPSNPEVHAPWGPNVVRLHDPAWVSLERVLGVVDERLGQGAA